MCIQVFTAFFCVFFQGIIQITKPTEQLLGDVNIIYQIDDCVYIEVPPRHKVRFTTLEKRYVVEVEKKQLRQTRSGMRSDRPGLSAIDSLQLSQIFFYYNRKCSDPDLLQGWGHNPDGHVFRNVSVLSVRVVRGAWLDYSNPTYSLIFSFHPEHTVMPRQLSPGRWNCSGVQRAVFQIHYPCNLYSDCVGGEDEAGCPYTKSQV